MKRKHLLTLILLSLFIYSCNNDDENNNSEDEFSDRCILDGNSSNPVTIGETRTFTTGDEVGLSVLWETTGEIELLRPIDSRIMEIRFNDNFMEGTLSVQITGDNLSCTSGINFTN